MSPCRLRSSPLFLLASILVCRHKAFLSILFSMMIFLVLVFLFYFILFFTKENSLADRRAYYWQMDERRDRGGSWRSRWWRKAPRSEGPGTPRRVGSLWGARGHVDSKCPIDMLQWVLQCTHIEKKREKERKKDCEWGIERGQTSLVTGKRLN